MKKKVLLSGISLLVLALAFMILFAGVDKSVTSQDRLAIAKLDVDDQCGDIPDFLSQLGCVKAIQASLARLFPEIKCSEVGLDVEPMSFLKRGYGCCFERSRFIEKALHHYGLETRHVAMHTVKLPVVGYLMAASSHQSSEVKTEKGWLYVDSNNPFVLMTKGGEPLSLAASREVALGNLVQKPVPEEFFNKRPTIVYGMHSRHGKFYAPRLPFPDINWEEFMYNFLG